jgi:phytoene synthase
VLPQNKRRAICAIYAFMRYCDDVSDSKKSGTSKLGALQQWRLALDNALKGDYGGSNILAAFHDAVNTFRIPGEYFHMLIDGAEMDLSVNRYQTFEDLYQYCYRVASVVGLTCIHIFGFKNEMAKEYAEYCGVAFQLTNILRDIKEDAGRNRIYIPQEDLVRFGYSEDDLTAGVLDDRFRNLMAFEIKRARDYYKLSMPLIKLVDLTSRSGLIAMIGIYSSLLSRIEERGYDVFSNRIALSSKEKIAIAARSILRPNARGREQVLTGIRK